MDCKLHMYVSGDVVYGNNAIACTQCSALDRPAVAQHAFIRSIQLEANVSNTTSTPLLYVLMRHERRKEEKSKQDQTNN